MLSVSFFLFLSLSHSQGDENSIYNAVGTIGPVSICFDVVATFQFYSHGVYSR